VLSEQAQSFLDLHLHPGLKSGLPPGPGKIATHPAFFTFGFSAKSKHELVTSQTHTDNL
jgi:hypothetical protein